MQGDTGLRSNGDELEWFLVIIALHNTNAPLMHHQCTTNAQLKLHHKYTTSKHQHITNTLPVHTTNTQIIYTNTPPVHIQYTDT